MAVGIGGALLSQGEGLWIWIPVAGLGLVIAVAIGIFGAAKKSEPALEIVEREPDREFDGDAFAQAAHPYRARVARVARRAVPLSGKLTALLLGASMVVTGVSLPLVLHLPHWIEFEIVLLFWWLSVAVLLMLLLYRDFRLIDDHRFRAPRVPTGSDAASLPAGCGEAAGCSEALLVVVILVVAAFAAWMLVEIVLPVLFLGVYFFTLKAVGRVARDRHDCRGSLGRSLAWGSLWASVYVLPVGLVVWAVHVAIALKMQLP